MLASQIQLIAGLANPGQRYAKTRHNAGAWLVSALAASLPLKDEPRFHGVVTRFVLKNEGDKGYPCWLLIPTTFMNHSGRSVSALAHFYKIPTEAILVVHDDLDLPPGIARFKSGGGDGGHNGVKDIVAHLGSQDFWRLRMGIGHPGHRDHVHQYVLSPPSATDKKKIDEVIAYALTLLLIFVEGEHQQAIQQLHTFKPNEEKE